MTSVLMMAWSLEKPWINQDCLIRVHMRGTVFCSPLEPVWLILSGRGRPIVNICCTGLNDSISRHPYHLFQAGVALSTWCDEDSEILVNIGSNSSPLEACFVALLDINKHRSSWTVAWLDERDSCSHPKKIVPSPSSLTPPRNSTG